jgi:hypothetical protein
MNNEIKNTAMATNVACQCNASRMPTIVATPFHPLKPANTGKTCPITAAAPNTN